MPVFKRLFLRKAFIASPIEISDIRVKVKSILGARKIVDNQPKKI